MNLPNLVSLIIASMVVHDGINIWIIFQSWYSFQAKVENLKRTCFVNIFLTNDERKIAITKNCARCLDEKMTRR